MKPVNATGRISKGKLYIDNRQQFDSALACLPDSDVEITIDAMFTEKTTPARRYYWVIITIIRDYLREEWQDPSIDKEFIHYWLGGKVDYREVVDPETGKTTRIPRSIKRLNDVRIAERTEKIRQYALEYMNLQTPDPEKKKKNETDVLAADR